jgi:DNA modification methylase
MKIENRKIKDLKFAEYNARKSTPTQEKHLKESLEKFGVVEPIILNENPQRFNIIIGGHFRVRELKKLNIKDVDCVLVNLNEDDEKELNIRLNANIGSWDDDLLKKFNNVDDLNDWGVDWLTNERVNIDDIEDDNNYEEVLNTDIKQGDLFKLGRHYLLCGDSTDEESYKKLLKDIKCDVCFTSPPYFASEKKYLTKEKEQQENTNNKDYLSFLNNFTTFALKYSNLVFNNIQMLDNNKEFFIDYLYSHKKEIKEIIIWNKRNGRPLGTNCCITKIYEYIFFMSNNDNSKIGNKQSIPFIPNYVEITHSNNEFTEIHKAVFTIKLPTYFLSNCFKKNSNVLEPFCGTGTTLLACENTDNNCFAIEIEPKYCQLIINRYEEQTKIKAIKIE